LADGAGDLASRPYDFDKRTAVLRDQAQRPLMAGLGYPWLREQPEPMSPPLVLQDSRLERFYGLCQWIRKTRRLEFGFVGVDRPAVLFTQQRTLKTRVA
jgi:hypothetical protein